MIIFLTKRNEVAVNDIIYLRKTRIKGSEYAIHTTKGKMKKSNRTIRINSWSYINLIH